MSISLLPGTKDVWPDWVIQLSAAGGSKLKGRMSGVDEHADKHTHAANPNGNTQNLQAAFQLLGAGVCTNLFIRLV